MAIKKDALNAHKMHQKRLYCVSKVRLHPDNLIVHLSADPLGPVYRQIKGFGNGLQGNTLTPQIKDIPLITDKITIIPERFKLRPCEFRYDHPLTLPSDNMVALLLSGRKFYR